MKSIWCSVTSQGGQGVGSSMCKAVGGEHGSTNHGSTMGGNPKVCLDACKMFSF